MIYFDITNQEVKVYKFTVNGQELECLTSLFLAICDDKSFYRYPQSIGPPLEVSCPAVTASLNFLRL